MFWTAFIWGLGASCGAAFGLLLFFILFAALELITGRSATKKHIHDTHERSLEALVKRNEISRDTQLTLERIAEAAWYDKHKV